MTGGLSAGSSRAEALALIARALADAGIKAPAREARWLVESVLGLASGAALAEPDARLGRHAVALASALARRRAHEPLSRIEGWRDFRGARYELTAETLDPRPDTEVVVEAVLDMAQARRMGDSLAVLDLGTGTGAILGALLSELPGATGLAVDVSADALATARRNLDRLLGPGRVRYAVSDWFAAVEGMFDIIVSNPPYIETGALAALDPEVRLHDPLLALDGGADGFDAYRVLVAGLGKHLRRGGLVAFEVGAGQAAGVAGMLDAAGYRLLEIRKDSGGHERAIVAHRPE